eukprot:TRINITY_DN95888_c0_g1_i1.p1 TRINITY_DN95888_c0_g1~~TRINITY_DN95888_c0_g1_i1.p1  ORF type:complete len:354 (+),score=69.06 TRINITY_DN95888_c0_g1_i1:40-1062(+)
MAFGLPPDANRPKQFFPGVSSTRFDPISAGKVWTQTIRTEKESRSAIQYLEAGGKVGYGSKPRRKKSNVPSYRDAPRVSDLMPGYSSVNAVYDSLGWDRELSGQMTAPSIDKLKRPKSAGRLPTAVSAPSDRRSARTKEKHDSILAGARALAEKMAAGTIDDPILAGKGAASTSLLGAKLRPDEEIESRGVSAGDNRFPGKENSASNGRPSSAAQKRPSSATQRRPSSATQKRPSSALQSRSKPEPKANVSPGISATMPAKIEAKEADDHFGYDEAIEVSPAKKTAAAAHPKPPFAAPQRSVSSPNLSVAGTSASVESRLLQLIRQRCAAPGTKSQQLFC